MSGGHILMPTLKFKGRNAINVSPSPTVPMHPWEWLEQPWECIHMDCAGQFMGKMFLLVIDAHSRLPDGGGSSKCSINAEHY